METTQDRAVVLAVVIGLATLAVVGLTGTIWLVHDGVDAAAVAVIAGTTGTATGALGGLLASTRTGTAAVGAAEAAGFQKAVDKVNELAP